MVRQTKPFRHIIKTHRWKKIKFTNFISRNPTETAEPEENYEEAKKNCMDFRPIRKQQHGEHA